MSAPPTQPALLSQAIDAVDRVLEAHRRELSQTLGVRCSCGAHYRTVNAWHRHQSELATTAVDEVMHPCATGSPST